MQRRLDKLESDISKMRTSFVNLDASLTMSKIQQLESTLETIKHQISTQSSKVGSSKAPAQSMPVVGRVTQKIQQIYEQSIAKQIMAPSPIELIHDFLCDYHVIKDSKLYRSVSSSRMLRSRSSGVSQLQTQSKRESSSLQEVILKLGDIQTQYGSQSGFKMIIPTSKQMNFVQIFALLTKIIPKHCLGITLDSNQAQLLLQDAQIVPQQLDPLHYQILFQRATYLQTKLIQNFTLHNSNSLLSDVYQLKQKSAEPELAAFNYNSIKRLAYPGLLFLVYTVAEYLDQKRGRPRDFQPPAQLQNPYDEYRFNEEIEDIDRLVATERSWQILHQFGRLLDENVLRSCKTAGMLVPQPNLTPDLRKYPNAIYVLTKHTQTIQRIFGEIKTESQLIDAQQLYKLCSRAGIHQQLSREFCFQVVMRLFTKIDKQTFVPGVDQDEFLTAIFVCANYALCFEPFVQRFRKPEDRLHHVLKTLGENQK